MRTAQRGLHSNPVDIDESSHPGLVELARCRSAIARAQQKLLVTGKLILVASVGPDGNVTEVKAIGSPSPEMTQAAASIVAVSKFKPAICKGQPCRMEFPFRFNFVVR